MLAELDYPSHFGDPLLRRRAVVGEFPQFAVKFTVFPGETLVELVVLSYSATFSASKPVPENENSLIVL